jgi:hypothetical protein
MGIFWIFLKAKIQLILPNFSYRFAKKIISKKNVYLTYKYAPNTMTSKMPLKENDYF